MERESLLRILLVAWSVGDVTFNTNDRLDAGVGCRLVDVDCAVKVSVVGERNGWLPKLNGSVDHIV